MNIVIKNGTTVSDNETLQKDILIEDGKIKAVKDSFDQSEIPGNCEVIDAEGLFVLPGLIDAHTHYQLVSRGTVTADKFYDGSILASFGGVTTIVDFSDHLPGKTLKEGALYRIKEAEGEIAVDFALHQIVTDVTDSIDMELEQLRDAGVTAVKIFTTYKNAGYFIEDAKIEKLFKACKALDIMVTIHAEDDDIIAEREKELASEDYPPDLLPLVRPSEAEYKAIMEYGTMAGEYDMPVYIVHLSSRLGLKAVRELKSKGIRVYAETTPTYLLLTDKLLSSENPQRFVMTPPLRKKDDNKALWEGIDSGDIQLVATDHCTFTLEQKLSSNDCRTIYPGIPGTEEMFQLIHSRGVSANRFSINKLVSLLSTEPARLFGLYPEKGSLLEGTDADIVLFNPNGKTTITDETRHTKAGYSPYSGMEVQGRVVKTILRGRIVVDNEEYKGEKGLGKFLKAGKPGVYT